MLINSKNNHPIRWDAHSCPPFKIGSDLSFLNRYKNAGLNLVSLNVGFDLIAQEETIAIIESITNWIKKHSDEFAIVTNAEHLSNLKLQNKLGIAFDIEGCNLLNQDLTKLHYFYSMGVKQISFTYNKNNLFGGGCFDNDTGLTALGKKLVEECNQIGMVIDCSHIGFRSSLEVIELSNNPVVFSHSNPSALVKHPRNISDQQIVACAKKGGVIGINGIGIFLGNNDIRTERIVEHIDYVVQLVGCKHVGIGLDCVFNPEEIKTYTQHNVDFFPAKHGFQDISIAEPEQFAEIDDLLSLRGYPEGSINDILGENFFRIAKNAWK